MSSKETIPHKGRHTHDGEQVPAVGKSHAGREVFFGTVVRVHTESMTMDVDLHDRGQPLTDVQIALPGMGPTSMIGVMPEKNGLVVIFKGKGSNRYVPIAYYPPDPTGGREYRVVELLKEGQTDVGTALDRYMPSKLRFMGEGDAIMASSGGAEAYLDKDVELHDGTGHEFRIRSGDGAMLSTSRNNFMFAHGVWRNAGLIQRNSLKVEDAGGTRTDVEATEVTLSDGQRAVFVGGPYLQFGEDLYTEYRIDVEDKLRLNTPLNDVNSEANYVHRVPTNSFVMGNYVGNDPADTQAYGKFLAPRFIEADKVDQGRFAFVPLARTGTEIEYDSKGASWSLERKGLSYLGVDKEGAMHRYLSGGAGAANGGWALTSVATGGRRELWGADQSTNTSWKATYRGAINWTVGKAQNSVLTNSMPRGILIKSEGSTFISHGDSSVDDASLKDFTDSTKVLGRYDQLGYGRVELVKGSARDEISQDYELKVGGDYKWDIGGSFSYQVAGAFGEAIFGDRTISTTAAFTTNSTEMKHTSGSRTEKLTTGNDDKTLLLGNDMTTIVAGQQITSIATGGKSTTIGAGNHVTNVGTGNFVMNVGAGNMAMSTKAGSVVLSTAAGTATIGGISTTATGTAKISLVAPNVTIGMPPTLSGVVTMLSHKCYITGLPPIGSFTVMASK